jgi:hypothetical protein
MEIDVQSRSGRGGTDLAAPFRSIRESASRLLGLLMRFLGEALPSPFSVGQGCPEGVGLSTAEEIQNSNSRFLREKVELKQWLAEDIVSGRGFKVRAGGRVVSYGGRNVSYGGRTSRVSAGGRNRTISSQLLSALVRRSRKGFSVIVSYGGSMASHRELSGAGALCELSLDRAHDKS